MTSFLQKQGAPGYKPHHIAAIKRREALPISEAQQKLEAALEVVFGQTLKKLPAHAGVCGTTISFSSEGALENFRKLKDEKSLAFNMLIDLTAVDWLDRREPRFEVVYQLLSLTFLHRLCVKVDVSEENPETDSVRPLWASANFMEREVWDMYGLRFRGHGDLRRILMYDEFVGHPLRKDYPILGKQPRIPLRVPELRNTADDLRREELVPLPSRRIPVVKTGLDEKMLPIGEK